MCGIAGFLGGIRLSDAARTNAILERMGRALVLRGPDNMGYWWDEKSQIAMVHRRLAVVDLSPAGAQPMISASGRYVVVFNGEIYNHRDLRTCLDQDWRGTSDTETLLAAFDRWGIEASLGSLVGMFAIAVWDRSEQSLTLIRDRMGEKPLYYGWQQCRGAESATLMFASDLAALRAHPAFKGDISRDALQMFMRYNNIGGSHSIYCGLYKLPAGCFVTLRAGHHEVSPKPYWSAEEVARDAIGSRLDCTEAAAADELEALLMRVIDQQREADVPLGVFLSGGVDSSLVAALMQRQSAAPIRTFSIGFRENKFNEAHFAEAVSQHLGTDHSSLYVSAQDAIKLIPCLPSIYSEPFADSSQVATHLLSLLTRRYVTVALTGDGGDELFCGYNRYALTDRYWHILQRIPVQLRSGLARRILGVAPDRWDHMAERLRTLVPPLGRWNAIGDKLHKAARVLGSESLVDLYQGLVSHWNEPSRLVIGGEDPVTPAGAVFNGNDGMSDIERMMLADVLCYMCDDVLVKVDRAAMAASLETRAPLLDHRVFELAWRVPMSMKLGGSQTKRILRQVLFRYVPQTLIDRPKSGFRVPIGIWLRGPLRDWAESLLDESRLRTEGFLNPRLVRDAWSMHLTGRQNLEFQLWNVLMFQAWKQHWCQN